MRKARYICFEGTEGVGKTTQTQKLVDYLRSKGYSVLQTKEPGTPLCPLTMQLRGIMLDNQYDKVLTRPARELISQAIRSIHLERVVYPAMQEYDFIIQDRGIVSGLSYGVACDNPRDKIMQLVEYVVPERPFDNDGLNNTGYDKPLYDTVIYLKGDPSKGLATAKGAKQEFEKGDAMESRGVSFIQQAAKNMDSEADMFDAKTINVDGKNIEQVFQDILSALDLKE